MCSLLDWKIRKVCVCVCTYFIINWLIIFFPVKREENGHQITLFFDMEGCGLANMDLEFTKYLIGLFKQYYPYSLNYILIFEMAWILNGNVLQPWTRFIWLLMQNRWLFCVNNLENISFILQPFVACHLSCRTTNKT